LTSSILDREVTEHGGPECPRLAALGYDVDTVLDEQLGGRGDNEVSAAAQAEGRLLVTHDLDFSDTRKFEPGKHAGVLVVRLPDSEQWRVGDQLIGWFSDPDARTWERCMVIATLRKVRVVRGATAQR
jgi:predicted nuclease of predicted toxin-antitoxin system